MLVPELGDQQAVSLLIQPSRSFGIALQALERRESQQCINVAEVLLPCQAAQSVAASRE
jgi:hypothetical protein